jgi:hypothetical protein
VITLHVSDDDVYLVSALVFAFFTAVAGLRAYVITRRRRRQ